MKKSLLTFLIVLSISFSPVLAQEYTAFDGPSDNPEELEADGQYYQDDEGNYYIEYNETRDKLNPELFADIINDSELKENSVQENNPDFLNYQKWQFWFLLIILILILFTLIRFLKKISCINNQIRRYEKRLSCKRKLKKDYPSTEKINPEIKENDEIIYE